MKRSNFFFQMIEWYRKELAQQPHLALMHSLYQCLPDGQPIDSRDLSEQKISQGKLRYLITNRGKEPLGTVLQRLYMPCPSPIGRANFGHLGSSKFMLERQNHVLG